jgi:ATP-dependent RNA helicase SUPV3L1/SUV3
MDEMIGMTRLAELFPLARAMGRRFILHVGPTNSGKTWAAMERLAAARAGVYLAPLRLLALEGAEQLQARGVPADLLTGEEKRSTPGARHVSATVEMADFGKTIDVAVIDEAQMLADPSRGWAWSAALYGIPASEIILCGSADMIPFAEAILEKTGETMEIVRFERKTPLDVVRGPENIDGLERGDAVIAFSRNEVMRLRREIMETGRSVACIYGALGPEVRRAEAERFRDGRADVIVATDAIGMGLNLPIRRLIFSALSKYDGVSERRLSDSEIRQIGGRAGRFGQFERGFVGCLGTPTPPFVERALLAAPAEDDDDVRPYAFPSWEIVAAAARHLGSDSLPHILHWTCSAVLEADGGCRVADVEDAMALARIGHGTGLPLKTRYIYAACPVDLRDLEALPLLRRWMLAHAAGETVPHPRWNENDIPKDDRDLQQVERIVRRIGAYLWCAMRWKRAFAFPDDAKAERDRLNGLIEAALRTARALVDGRKSHGGGRADRTEKKTADKAEPGPAQGRKGIRKPGARAGGRGKNEKHGQVAKGRKKSK